MPQWKRFIPFVECMCRVCGEAHAVVRAKFHSHSVPSPTCQPFVDEKVCSNVAVGWTQATISGKCVRTLAGLTYA
jgi:hypothetical protein